jgi:hypothetical protein
MSFFGQTAGEIFKGSGIERTTFNCLIFLKYKKK